MTGKSLAKLIYYNFLVLIGLLLVVEIVLRLIGFKPGLIVDRAPFAYNIDTFFVYKDYEADENGIMKFSQRGRKFVAQGIANNGEVHEQGYILINMLIDDFLDVEKGKVDNAFSKFIKGIEAKDPDSLTALDKAYLAYCKSPINSDGFRSIEFVDYKTDKLKILLLGDSHTYGAEATNITSSFADNLAAKGYVVYNTGVVATDPAQYLAVAKKYIPALKPDIVIVSFCLNNDIVYFKREPKPYQMMFYATNVENLMACPDGEYLKTPREAYEFIRDECYIPDQDKILINRLAAKTVLTTKLWLALRNAGILIHNSPKRAAYLKRTAKLRSDKPVSEYFMLEIKKLSEKYGAKFFIGAIPDGDDLDKRPPDIDGLFDHIGYHVPENTGKADRAEGGHFNDSGYRKYADFLANIIDSIEAK